MNLLVSTNVYKPGQLARVIPHLHAFRWSDWRRAVPYV